jgi:hypothetical protein
MRCNPAPTLAPAPGRLSMTTGWPGRAELFAHQRASRSRQPRANGTIIFNRFVG